MIFIGVDPGKSGGIAIITGTTVATFKLDQTETDIANWLNDATFSRTGGNCRAVLEQVHACPAKSDRYGKMRGQGVSSAFAFGQSYGFVRGLLIALKIPYFDVSPQRWQKALRCLTKGDKRISKAKAQQLFPQVTVTHANADALLLAEYARRSWGSTLESPPAEGSTSQAGASTSPCPGAAPGSPPANVRSAANPFLASVARGS